MAPAPPMPAQVQPKAPTRADPFSDQTRALVLDSLRQRERQEPPPLGQASRTLVSRDMVGIKKQGLSEHPAKPLIYNGGRDWDRTSDPYDVNVVLSR